jgi:hypothetical protein
METIAGDAIKCIIEVSAGIIPGEPEPNFTRRWTITSDEWERAQAQDAAALQAAQEGTDDADHAFAAAMLLAFRAAEADEYARLLRNPGRFNFVRTDWLWV